MSIERRKMVANNKKAFFNYEIVAKYTAGIILKGSEVKAIRIGKASFQDAYCYFDNDELWLKGMYIGEYAPAAHQHHDPERSKKLLLERRELRKLQRKKEEKTFAIVALCAFINEKNLIKVEIALARGKKKYDKRHKIKERDIQRKIEIKEKESY